MTTAVKEASANGHAAGENKTDKPARKARTKKAGLLISFRITDEKVIEQITERSSREVRTPSNYAEAQLYRLLSESSF